jgi:hypothetical protein
MSFNSFYFYLITLSISLLPRTARNSGRLPMIERRPFNQLGGEDHGWLKAEHHFSFADYRDATRMGWGSLRVWNDAVGHLTARPGSQAAMAHGYRPRTSAKAPAIKVERLPKSPTSCMADNQQPKSLH